MSTKLPFWFKIDPRREIYDVPTFEEAVIATVDALSNHIGWLLTYYEEAAADGREETETALKEQIDRAQQALDDALDWQVDPYLSGLVGPKPKREKPT
jgi:hypothetical protein